VTFTRADDGRRRTLRTWATSLAAAADLVAACIAGSAAISAHNRLQGTETQLGESAGATLTDPDLRTTTDLSSGGSLTLLTSPSRHRGVLIMVGMAGRPADSTYQAWAVGPGSVRSLGLLDRQGTGALTVTLGQARSIGVTVEPAHGSRRPTTIPIANVTVPT
jgi:anti-sigma-K factor RskA